MQSSGTKSFYTASRDVKKIIVVDLGFLGDTVHLVPALWEIKRHYPRAELHALSSPVGAEVLKMAPCVDRVWAFPLGPPSPSWWEHWDILRALRRERFDAAFNFNGADRTVFVTALLRPRHAIAYRGARKHFWQPWLIRHWIPKTQLPTPVYEGRRHILEQCGFALQPPRFDLRVPAAEQAWAQANIPAGAVHLSLNASMALRDWPIPNAAQLARHLFAESPAWKIVVTGAPTPREQARLKQLRDEIPDSRLLILNERLSLARLAAILERCLVHVGPDSGMIHLATALNVPTISLFRRNKDMAEWLPIGPSHLYFDAPCQCVGVENPPCAATNVSACLAQISGDVVGAEICRRRDLAGRAVKK